MGSTRRARGDDHGNRPASSRSFPLPCPARKRRGRCGPSVRIGLPRGGAPRGRGELAPPLALTRCRWASRPRPPFARQPPVVVHDLDPVKRAVAPAPEDGVDVPPGGGTGTKLGTSTAAMPAAASRRAKVQLATGKPRSGRSAQGQSRSAADTPRAASMAGSVRSSTSSESPRLEPRASVAGRGERLAGTAGAVQSAAPWRPRRFAPLIGRRRKRCWRGSRM